MAEAAGARRRKGLSAQPRHSEAHVAICVDIPEAKVLEIAHRAGWRARHCERGGGYFSLVEMWVGNAFVIEVLDPGQTRIYRERVTMAKFKEAMARMQVGARQ